MKQYRSKRHPDVVAEVIKEDTKAGTVMLRNASGDTKGETATISTGTLKRWWELIGDVESSETEESPKIEIDNERLNTPYPEPKEKKYIPKPQSVINYENSKRVRVNTELPTQDEMVERFGSMLTKINKTYIVFNTGDWFERKSGYLNIYATETTWNKLAEIGFTCRVNGMKDKVRPVVIKASTLDEYEKVAGIMENG